jgi:hypothetical protein
VDQINFSAKDFIRDNPGKIRDFYRIGTTIGKGKLK